VRSSIALASSAVVINNKKKPNLNVKSLRVLCALAAQHDLILENMDFETAYLNAPTSSELYLRPAPGSLLPGEEPYVVPLQRALYGVRDSGKYWNEEITTSLTEFGLKQSHYDPCVFFMIADTKPTMIFELYTDDLISGHHASTETEYQRIKSAIKERYATRDVDLRLNNFVGHRITQNLAAGTITLDQDEYIQSVLAEFPSAKSVPVPCKDDAATKILPRDAPATDYPYRRVPTHATLAPTSPSRKDSGKDSQRHLAPNTYLVCSTC